LAQSVNAMHGEVAAQHPAPAPSTISYPQYWLLPLPYWPRRFEAGGERVHGPLTDGRRLRPVAVAVAALPPSPSPSLLQSSVPASLVTSLLHCNSSTLAVFVIVLDLEHAPPGSTPTRPQLLSLPGRAHDVVPVGVQVPVQVYPSQKSTPKPNQESVSCLPALPRRCTQATDQPPRFSLAPNLPNKLP
jgi:hypothetical protein